MSAVTTWTCWGGLALLVIVGVVGIVREEIQWRQDQRRCALWIGIEDDAAGPPAERRHSC